MATLACKVMVITTPLTELQHLKYEVNTEVLKIRIICKLQLQWLQKDSELLHLSNQFIFSVTIFFSFLKHDVHSLNYGHILSKADNRAS